MYQTFLQIYFFLLCVNGGIFIVENTAPNFPLTSPFDNTHHVANVTKASFGNLYNATNNTGTVSNQIDNPTNGTTPFNWFTDWFNISLAVVQTIFGILFGGFIGQVFALFAFPWPFTFVVSAFQGFFLIITGVYYLTGKGL